jgi:hypothetical protein
MTWYLKSTKHTGLKFKIVTLDKESRNATLQGDTGVPFSVKLSNENLAKYGYTVVKVEENETASEV